MAGLEFIPSVSVEVVEPAPMSAAGMPAESRGAGFSPAAPRLVFKRNEAALAQPVRLTRDQRIYGWVHFIRLAIEPHIKARKDYAAIYRLAEELAAVSTGHLELIDGLEDRITALEAAKTHE